MTMVHWHKCRGCGEEWICSLRDCDMRDECLSCERDEFEDWMGEHGHNTGNDGSRISHGLRGYDKGYGL